MNPFKTRSGHVALLHVTWAEVIPASAEGYKPTDKTNFLLKAIGDTPIPLTVRLADHNDTEAIPIVVTSSRYTEELIREVVTEVTENTLIAGY